MLVFIPTLREFLRRNIPYGVRSAFRRSAIGSALRADKWMP